MGSKQHSWFFLNSFYNVSIYIYFYSFIVIAVGVWNNVQTLILNKT